MFRALRRCPALALTLLLAVPGLGGTWLSVAHPCPVDTPWLNHGGHAGHQTSDAGGGHDAPAESPTTCHCIGACQNAAAALTSIAAAPAFSPVLTGWNTAPSSPDSDTPAQPRLRRHPPSTAPPLA